jgi:DNA-binding NtrC family response regulator
MARILLADDDAATRDLVRRALAGDGHDVIVTQDGQEALDALLATPTAFDLLITDVQMPVLDGLALARQAKVAAPKLRIVLMSGLAHGFKGTDALKPNLRTTMTKPFTLDQMRQTVRQVLLP